MGDEGATEGTEGTEERKSGKVWWVMEKAAFVDASRLRRAFKESVEGQAYVRVASAMYRDALTDGLGSNFRKMQGTWPRLNRAYRQRKNRQGFSIQTWKRTGATLRAITNNPPNEKGKVRAGLRFGVNFTRDLAFARPTKFPRDGAGGKLTELTNSQFQIRIFNTLRYGNRRGKLEGYLERNPGKGKAKDYVKLGRREGRLKGRPLMTWTPEIVRQAEKDVAAAMEKLITEGAGKP